jgi:hypothetical protein
MTCLSKASEPPSPSTRSVAVDRNTLRWIAESLHILACHIETNLLNRPEEQQPEPAATKTPLPRH